MASWAATHKKGMGFLYTKSAIVTGIILSCLQIAMGVGFLIVLSKKAQPIETLVLVCDILTIGFGVMGLIVHINRLRRVMAGESGTL